MAQSELPSGFGLVPQGASTLPQQRSVGALSANTNLLCYTRLQLAEQLVRRLPRPPARSSLARALAARLRVEAAPTDAIQGNTGDAVAELEGVAWSDSLWDEAAAQLRVVPLPSAAATPQHGNAARALLEREMAPDQPLQVPPGATRDTPPLLHSLSEKGVPWQPGAPIRVRAPGWLLTHTRHHSAHMRGIVWRTVLAVAPTVRPAVAKLDCAACLYTQPFPEPPPAPRLSCVQAAAFSRPVLSAAASWPYGPSPAPPAPLEPQVQVAVALAAALPPAVRLEPAAAPLGALPLLQLPDAAQGGVRHPAPQLLLAPAAASQGAQALAAVTARGQAFAVFQVRQQRASLPPGDLSSALAGVLDACVDAVQHVAVQPLAALLAAHGGQHSVPSAVRTVSTRGALLQSHHPQVVLPHALLGVSPVPVMAPPALVAPRQPRELLTAHLPSLTGAMTLATFTNLARQAFLRTLRPAPSELEVLPSARLDTDLMDAVPAAAATTSAASTQLQAASEGFSPAAEAASPAAAAATAPTRPVLTSSAASGAAGQLRVIVSERMLALPGVCNALEDAAPSFWLVERALPPCVDVLLDECSGVLLVQVPQAALPSSKAALSKAEVPRLQAALAAGLQRITVIVSPAAHVMTPTCPAVATALGVVAASLPGCICVRLAASDGDMAGVIVAAASAACAAAVATTEGRMSASDWRARDWITERVSAHEAFLAALPGMNALSAQVLLSLSPLSATLRDGGAALAATVCPPVGLVPPTALQALSVALSTDHTPSGAHGQAVAELAAVFAAPLQQARAAPAALQHAAQLRSLAAASPVSLPAPSPASAAPVASGPVRDIRNNAEQLSLAELQSRRLALESRSDGQTRLSWSGASEVQALAPPKLSPYFPPAPAPAATPAARPVAAGAPAGIAQRVRSAGGAWGAYLRAKRGAPAGGL